MAFKTQAGPRHNRARARTHRCLMLKSWGAATGPCPVHASLELELGARHAAHARLVQQSPSKCKPTQPASPRARARTHRCKQLQAAHVAGPTRRSTCRWKLGRGTLPPGGTEERPSQTALGVRPRCSQTRAAAGAGGRELEGQTTILRSTRADLFLGAPPPPSCGIDWIARSRRHGREVDGFSLFRAERP